MEDEIDYSSLSDDELEQIAQSDDVLSLAPALNELHERSPQRATVIAEKLLGGNDEWLRATALDIVFHEKQPLALEYMKHHAAACSVPVLRVMVEMLAADSRTPERSTIEELLVQVRDRLRDAKGSAVDDSRELFFRKYPDLLSH